MDFRSPCPTAERPTDEEARQNGFKDGLDWYTQTVAGALLGPKAIKTNFEALPLPASASEEKPTEEKPVPAEPEAPVQEQERALGESLPSPAGGGEPTGPEGTSAEAQAERVDA